MGGGVAWHRGGVGGYCGESLHIDLQAEDGWWKIVKVAKSGVCAWAQLRGYAGRICGSFCMFEPPRTGTSASFGESLQSESNHGAGSIEATRCSLDLVEELTIMLSFLLSVWFWRF